MHGFPRPAKFRILFYHFFEAIIDVLDLISACHVAGSVHTCATMDKYYRILSFLMDFVMKLSDKVINVVDIDDVTEH